ncbi:TPA: endonuclease III [Candidatus Spyradomonas excrementavium]|nr:endonuclease III [Candidatus Spyradomonas excrementavium]
MNKSQKNIDKIIQALKDANLPQRDFVKMMETFHDPFKVLICCILSLRTNDLTTYPCSLRMLEIGTKPEDFLNVDVETLAKAIYPVGFYKNKAQQILDISRDLVENYGSKVPASIDELVKFKGVGRKTANLVMAKGFDIPAICVDVHVHRISNRLGWVKTKTPEETEMALRKLLPEKYWLDINTILVTFGQNLCRPTKPMCEKCPVAEFCESRGT